MMDDVISRQAAIEAIFNEPLCKSGMKERTAIAVVLAIYEKINSLPSAQPEVLACGEGELIAQPEDICSECDAWNVYKNYAQPQRKKGRWILVKGSNGKDYHKCSECLHTQEITGVKNYCAVCGAEMGNEYN